MPTLHISIPQYLLPPTAPLPSPPRARISTHGLLPPRPGTPAPALRSLYCRPARTRAHTSQPRPPPNPGIITYGLPDPPPNPGIITHILSRNLCLRLCETFFGTGTHLPAQTSSKPKNHYIRPPRPSSKARNHYIRPLQEFLPVPCETFIVDLDDPIKRPASHKIYTLARRGPIASYPTLKHTIQWPL